MKSFFDTFPREPEGSSSGIAAYWVIMCPADGKLGRAFKPVPVEPWEPARLQTKRRPVRLVEPTLLVEITARPRERFGDPITYVTKQYDGTPNKWDELNGEPPEAEAFEWENLHFFEPVEAYGIRSLMQPRISDADYSWRAPAARCRSCGCETWVASISEGIRMIKNPRHRKGCTAPPSRLEVEQSCDM